MGWLNAKPKDWQKSRWEKHVDATGKAPPLPTLDAGAYLFAAFNEVGKVSAGFSLAPLTWAEIDAYARLTGEIAEPFEARVIRSMSVAYLSGLRAGEDAFSRAPWGD